MKRRLFLAACFWPRMALAHSGKAGAILIGHSWALPSTQTDAQVFFPLLNNGTAEDALVAARSDICSLVELRENNRYDDPPLSEISLAPGKPVAMRPTARHLRLLGLSKPLVLGDRFSMILDFRDTGEAEIEVMVEAKPGQ